MLDRHDIWIGGAVQLSTFQSVPFIAHYDGRRWATYAYRWNDAQDDAELVPAEGLELELTIRDPDAPGGSRSRPWHISGRAECARCHNTDPATLGRESARGRRWSQSP